MSSEAALSGDDHSVDVVVAGAGIAGLRAATLLQRSGYRTLVVEARSRVGGRLRSVPVGSARLDLGATWFWPSEPTINALSGELAAAAFPQHLAGDTMMQNAEGVQRIPGNQLDIPASRLVEGMERLAQQLAEQLDPDSMHLDTEVTRITNDSATGGLRVDTSAFSLPKFSFTAEHVVLAVPPALAIATIELDGLDDRTRALAEATPVWMGGIVKVVAVYPRPFWRAEGLAGAAFSHLGPMREIHDMSGPDGQPAALFGFAQPDAAADAPTEAEIIAQLIALFGPNAAEPDSIHIADWRRDRFATPPGIKPLTNYRTYGHPGYQVPALDGRLHWASTETATHSPGHVEGALLAGTRAASAINQARRDDNFLPSPPPSGEQP